MTEKIQSIPARIKNIAKGGHVAGTEDIIDDTSGKTQKEINTETGNKVDALQKQDIEAVTSLPAVSSADPKKIYRVAGETSYTDYMLNAAGSQFVAIATYSFPGIDDEPIDRSENLVKSGGVAAKFNSMDLVETEIERKYEDTDLKNGYFDGVNGNKSQSSAYKRSNYIPVNEGDVFTAEGSAIKFVWGQLNGVNVPSAGRTNVTIDSYTVPSGVDVVVISGLNTMTKVIKTYVSNGKLPSQVVKNTQNIGDLETLSTEDKSTLVNAVNEAFLKEEEINNNLDFVEYEDTESEDYTTNFQTGYRQKDGTWKSNSNFKYVNIEVNEGDVITADKNIRFVCAYNGGTVLPDKGYDNVWLSSYIVPSGVTKVAVSAPNTVAKFTRTYNVTKGLPSQVLQNMQDIENLTNEGNDIFLNMIKSPFVIGWAEEGYYALGRAIASRRLENELQAVPFVNEKLFESDAYGNSAGYCIYNDGYVYILKYQNHISGGSNGEPEYSDLAKVDTANGNVVGRLKLFNDVDITFEGGETYHCGRIYQNAFVIVGDKIKVIGSSSISPNFDITNTNVVICATINPATFEVEKYEKCYMTENDATVLWSKDSRIDPLIVQTSIKDSYIYAVCRTVTSGKYAIVRSIDFVNFEVVAYLPTEQEGLNAYGEFGIDVNGNYCHVACRISPYSGEFGNVSVSSAATVILKYDIRSWKLLKCVEVASGLSMTTFFRSGGNLYAIVCGAYNKRNYYRFLYIDEDYLENSRVIADENNSLIGANTIICSDGTYLYGCKTAVNLHVVKFHVPSFTKQEADTLTDYLISQLT